MKRSAILLALLLLVASCEKVPRTAQEQYRAGVEAAAKGDWGRSAYLLKKALQGNLTPKQQEIATITLANAYFNDKDFENAALNYEEFLQLYPASPKAREALFRLGVCYLNLTKGPQWDVTFAKKAYEIFKEYLKKYPNGPEAEKAKLYAKIAKKILAEHELYVGGTYDMLHKFTASIQRYSDAQRRFGSVEAPDRLLYLLGRAYYYTPIQSKEEIERLKEAEEKAKERLRSKNPDEVRVGKYRLKLLKEEERRWRELAEKNREKGKELLSELIERYPNSPYAKKAKEILEGKKHLEVEPVQNPLKRSIWWKIKETF